MSETNADLKMRITEFIHKNFLMSSGAIKFTNDDSFMEKGIIDSTGVLEMVNFIQQNFNIKITDEDLVPENLDSVNKIISFVQKKQNNAS